MKFVSVKELSAIGKGAIALIATLGALLQVPQMSAVVFKLANLHPHLATITGCITVMASLLANTQVQKILGIEQTEQVTAPDGTKLTTTQTTTVSKE